MRVQFSSKQNKVFWIKTFNELLTNQVNILELGKFRLELWGSCFHIIGKGARKIDCQFEYILSIIMNFA